MFIRLKNGATWQVLGSDRYDAAVGSPPHGITFSEWALSNPAAWAYLAPIVLENNGWAVFITTARGRNHAKTMLDMAQTRQDWFSEVLPVNVSGAMTDAAVEAQRQEYTGIFGQEAADALIDQDYYCSFEAAILGRLLGQGDAARRAAGPHLRRPGQHRLAGSHRVGHRRRRRHGHLVLPGLPRSPRHRGLLRGAWAGLRPLLRMARPAGLSRHRLVPARREGPRGGSAWGEPARA